MREGEQAAHLALPADSEQLNGTLDAAETDRLPGSAFAFPGLRGEPLVSASHVRNALARFDQVIR